MATMNLIEILYLMGAMFLPWFVVMTILYIYKYDRLCMLMCMVCKSTVNHLVQGITITEIESFALYPDYTGHLRCTPKGLT